MNDDSAGPMIGWSLGQGSTKKLDDLMEFPCVYTFKVVGPSGGTFKARVRDALETIGNTKIPASQIEEKASAKGTYTSITLRVEVETAASVYKMYEELAKVEGVRYVL